MCVFAGSRSVGSQLQSSSGCWLEVSVERSGQLWNHYHRHARGKIWTPCHLSTNHSLLIKLTCVCMLVLECVYAHMCMCVCVCVHAKLRESLGMLAEEKECRTVCVCAHVCGGVIDESRTLPNILCLYICLKVRWHPKGPQHMCMCALVEGEECPARAQLSKHVPVSCLSAPLMEK